MVQRAILGMFDCVRDKCEITGLVSRGELKRLRLLNLLGRLCFDITRWKPSALSLDCGALTPGHMTYQGHLADDTWPKDSLRPLAMQCTNVA